MSVILDKAGLARMIVRLSHEIEERNEGTEGVCLLGIKRGGEAVARRVAEAFAARGVFVPYAGISIGMHRDDLVTSYFIPEAEKNEIGFSVEGKRVVLCDDVLHTGRSAVAGIEALFRLGRPERIQLLVLVDRGGRELPVRADFVGKNVPTSRSEYVSVHFKELGAECDELSIIGRNQC